MSLTFPTNIVSIDLAFLHEVKATRLASLRLVSRYLEILAGRLYIAKMLGIDEVELGIPTEKISSAFRRFSAVDRDFFHSAYTASFTSKEAEDCYLMIC